MSYQPLLHELAPDLNPAGVESSMRLHYGTFNHLPRETFVAEAKLAADLEGKLNRAGFAGDQLVRFTRPY